jgi:hypothetical protein
MRKGQGSAYDKWSISVVNCDTSVNQVMVVTVKLSKWWPQLTKRNPWFNSFLIRTTSSGISYLLRDILSICRCSWNVATYIYINGKWEILNNLFCRKVSFLTATHWQFRGVRMKHIYLFLWYPLFQSQWDRCDQQNPQT